MVGIGTPHSRTKADSYIRARFPTDLPSTPTHVYANQQLTAYDTIRDSLPPDKVPSFEDWKKASIHHIIESITSHSKNDAEALVNLIPRIAPQTYFER